MITMYIYAGMILLSLCKKPVMLRRYDLLRWDFGDIILQTKENR